MTSHFVFRQWQRHAAAAAKKLTPSTTFASSTSSFRSRYATSAAVALYHPRQSLPTPSLRSMSSSPLSPTTQQQQQDLVAGLQEMLPSHVQVSQNAYELERHGRGESFHPTEMPTAVIYPTTVDEIVTICQYCSEHLLPIIPFGVGTSVEGHVCCVDGGISLNMEHFSSIEIPNMEGDEGLPDPIAVAGAGVTRNTLNSALRHTGMQFVVDPGADATIGGMVATGASGTTAVRYGTMRENILEVECVLADGTVVNTGAKALKNSAGYDLLGLMCGSEGTLGIITKVTVKLHAIPQHVVAALCVFDTLEHAAQAVATLKLCDIPLLRCELLDEMSMAAFNAYKKEGPDRQEKPTLFLEFQAPSEESLEEQVQMTKSILCDDFGADNFVSCSEEQERKALWSARHSLYYASLNLRPGSKGAILTDACVPLSKFAQVIQETAQDVQEKNVIGPCFGHAGDGNFHCILPMVEGDSEEYTQKLHEISNNLVQRAIKAGGTCTGEHGVGYGKIKYLQQQYGPGAIHMMELVKRSLDPNNIMNPGKVVRSPAS